MNEIKQSQTTNSKYAARRKPSCPDPGIGRRHLQSEGYRSAPKNWTESNYPPGSQGLHGEVPSASSGDSYSGRRTSGGGY
jgi:hypothetical protein